MKANQAKAEPQESFKDLEKPCEVCGKKCLPYGFTQSGQICSRTCSDVYDANKYRSPPCADD